MARRMDPSIGPLAGLRDQSAEAYLQLASLLTPDQSVALFYSEPPRLPAGWTVTRQAALVQMICSSEPTFPAGDRPEITPLTHADVPAMLELVELTQPGPFARRTIELGGYLGIWQDGRLAAMAGQRLAPTGFIEVSAVCTHPDFRGRQYAHWLVASVAHHIRVQAATPFLTSLADNSRAISVYEAAGFASRRSLELIVMTLEAPSS